MAGFAAPRMGKDFCKAVSVRTAVLSWKKNTDWPKLVEGRNREKEVFQALQICYNHVEQIF